MPRIPKYSRERIIDAAFAIVREQGADALSARTLASRLGCSVRPIFDAFANMEELRHAVWLSANEAYNDHARAAMEDGGDKPYLASGLAYIDFARREPRLFAMLFMRPRTRHEMEQAEQDVRPVVEFVAAQLDVSYERAWAFHMQLWVYVHGLATMIASRYLEWDGDFVERSTSDVYRALKAQLEAERTATQRSVATKEGA